MHTFTPYIPPCYQRLRGHSVFFYKYKVYKISLNITLNINIILPLSNNLVVQFFEVFSCSGSIFRDAQVLFQRIPCLINISKSTVHRKCRRRESNWFCLNWWSLHSHKELYVQYVLSISSGMCCLFWGEKKKFFSFN